MDGFTSWLTETRETLRQLLVVCLGDDVGPELDIDHPWHTWYDEGRPSLDAALKAFRFLVGEVE